MRRVLTAACIGMLWMAGEAAAGQRAAAQSKPTDSSTYVGCLRAQDTGRFMLTEVGGPDVPESRNWRSLFLTAERVLELDASRAVNVRDHVGHTVRVTGRRDGRMLHARSVTFVGATCR